MNETRLTTILHVSDIHFTKVSQQDFDKTWRAFATRITQLRDDQGSIDFVCLTGDFVKRADEGGSYQTLIDGYFLPLFDELDCYDRIMFCPGNHDASRSFVDANLQYHFDLIKRLEAGERLSEAELIELQDKKFAAFQQSCGGLASPTRLGASPLFPIYYDKSHDVGFVCLNSALFTFTGIDDPTTHEKISDERKLAFPYWLLDQALSAAPSPARWIFLMHHPLDWMQRDSASGLQRIISEKRGLLLHGHMHEGRPSVNRDIFGDSFQHQAGALYSDDPGRFNGFSLIRNMPGHPHVEVNLESFFPLRTAFDVAVEICPNGRFYSSTAAEAFWKNPPIPTNLVPLKQWTTGMLVPHLVEEFRDPMAQRPLAEIFVEPPLSKVSAQREITMSLVDDLSDVKLDALLAQDGNVLFVADRESSRSTLLRMSALRLAARTTTEREFCTIPVVINFAAFSKNIPLATRAIRNAMADGIPSEWTAARLLEHGLLTILIDDFSGTDDAALKTLSAFMQKFPKNRYLLAGERRVESVISPTIQVELPLPVTIVEIGQLRPRHVRELIVQWKKVNHEAADPLLKRILEDTLAMNLPLSANNVSILIQLDEVPDLSRPVNRAALVERYVELLLRKSSLAEILQGKFDFHNRVHFLAWIAGQMVFENQYHLENEWLETHAKKYVEKFGFVIPIDQWIQQFLDARILTYDNGGFSFRFRAFLEYFIAQGMKNFPELLNHVTHIGRYLDFSNEIEFYAGLTRTDEKLLDLIAERFSDLRAELSKQTDWLPDLSLLHKMSAPTVVRGSRSSTLFEDVERHLKLPAVTYAERDQELERQVPKNLGVDQRVKRSALQEEEDARLIVGRYYGLMNLYSRLVKNTELIEGAAKQKHLEAALGSWAEFWILALSLIPTLARERKATIAGIRFVVVAPKELTAEQLGYDLYVTIPVNMARSAYAVLGSDKLRRQIENSDNVTTELGAVTFLKRALSLDLRTPRAITLTKSTFQQFGKGTYLHLALLAKVRNWWRANSFTDKDHDDIINMLASEVTSSQKQGRARIDDENRQREKLLKDELVLKIKRQNESDDD